MRGAAGKLAGMLSTSRILSVLLLGLGVALLVAGLVVPRFIHADGRMPLDPAATTWTLRDDGAQTRLMTDPDGRVLEAPVTRQLHLEVQNPADGDEATVRIGDTFLRESRQEELDRLISAQVWSYRLDRLDGSATSPATLTDQIGSPGLQVDVEGVWLKFPTDAQQTTYEVFDPRLRQARPALFAESLEMAGREVYRYRQEIGPTNLAQLYADWRNTTVFAQEDGGTSPGYLFYSVTRDFLVDQRSGMVVEVREDIEEFYGDAEGQPREQVLSFQGRMTQPQVDVLLEQASEINDGTTAQLVRWIAIGVGAVLAVAGLAGSLGAFGGRRARHS